MGELQLPEDKIQATRLSPKILVMYGLPKVGKTEALTRLNDCLIIDLEEGTKAHNALKIEPKNMAELKSYGALLMKYQKDNGIPRYRRIAIDTTDMLEEWCEYEAADTYRKTAIGRNFVEKSILALPNGAGYGHQRNEVKKWIDAFAGICENLILVTHVKDKLIASKAGDEVSTKDISLVGKLASIVCSMADAVGYIYREEDELMISFASGDVTIAGARQPHLRGQKFPLDWSKIYID